MRLFHVIIIILLVICSIGDAKVKHMPIKELACSEKSLIGSSFYSGLLGKSLGNTGLRDISDKLNEERIEICKSDVGTREVIMHLDSICKESCKEFTAKETSWINNEIANNTQNLSAAEKELFSKFHIELSRLRCKNACSEATKSSWYYMLGFKTGLDKTSDKFLVK